MDALPTSYVGQRRCDLAEQSFHEAHEFDPASRAQLYERILLVEQAWLEMFGFAVHCGLSPPLIRTGESLGAHRPRHESSAEYAVENAPPRRKPVGSRVDLAEFDDPDRRHADAGATESRPGVRPC